jgi:hypothetical protein
MTSRELAPLLASPNRQMPASVKRSGIRFCAFELRVHGLKPCFVHISRDMGCLNAEEPPDRGDGGGGRPTSRRFFVKERASAGPR